MSLTISGKALAAAMSKIVRIIPARVTIPIMTHVRIEAAGGRMTLSACDQEMQMRLTLAADVDAPFAVAAPAAVLKDIVSGFPTAASIKLSMKPNGRMGVSSGRSDFKLPILPPSDFVSLRFADVPQSFTIDGPSLSSILDRTLFAVGREADRLWGQGSYLHIVERGILTSACFNGPQFASAAAPVDVSVEPFGVIVPTASAQEISKLAAAGAVEIAVTDRLIRVASPDAEIISKLIDSRFPDYANILGAESYRGTAIADTADFASCIERVSRVADERNRCLRMDFQSGSVTISADAGGLGEGEDVLSIDYEGGPRTIGFQANALLTAIRSIESETVEITMSDRLARIRPHSRAATSEIFVMSMRLRSAHLEAQAA